MKPEGIIKFLNIYSQVICYTLLFARNSVSAQIKKGDIQIFSESGMEYLETIKSYRFSYDNSSISIHHKFDTIKKEESNPVPLLYGSEIAFNKIFSAGVTMGTTISKSKYDSVIRNHSFGNADTRRDKFHYLLFTLSVRLINKKYFILSLNSQIGNKYNSFKYEDRRNYLYLEINSIDKYFRLCLLGNFIYRNFGVYTGVFYSNIFKKSKLNYDYHTADIPTMYISKIDYAQPSWGFRVGFFFRFPNNKGKEREEVKVTRAE
jgi:hypothetical protein